MKILFLSEHYKHNVQGGGEINLALLCEALVEQGHNIYVLTSFEGKKRVEEMDGVHVYCTVTTGAVDTLLGNLKRSLTFPKSMIAELKQLLSRQHFDLIHLIGSTLQLAPAIKRFTSTPIVATIESFLALCPKGDFICGNNVDISRWSFWKSALCVMNSSEIGKMKNVWYMRYNPVFFAFSYRRYIKMKRGLLAVYPLAVSNFVCSLLKNFYGVESTVIPNFVDIELFKSVKSEKIKENKKSVVLYLGSLTHYKGVDVLLNAVNGIDCTVKIYGTGALKPSLVEFIHRHGIDATICEPVPYAEIPFVYASADIVVFPSLWPEPFGRIAIEAMAAGKPVIGSDIGGIGETLKEAGILVKPGDVAQLHAVLHKLLKDGTLRKDISRKAAKAVLVYSKENILKQLMGVYQSVQHQ